MKCHFIQEDLGFLTESGLVSFKYIFRALANVAQLVGSSFCKAKGHRFDSWSGHIPQVAVQFPVGG